MLSSVLIIFLIILSVALGFAIAILRQIKSITNKAEIVAESVESAAATVRRTASRGAALRILTGLFNSAMKTRKGKD